MPKLIRRSDKWAVEVDRGIFVTWWFVGKRLFVSADGENIELGGYCYRDQLVKEGLE